MYHNQSMYDLCRNHLNRYVLVQTTDQQQYDGIVENVDETNLYLAVPVGEVMDDVESSDKRVIGVGGLGYGSGFGYGPGYYPGYGYPSYGPPFYPRPRRRFRRLVLPLAALAALTALPYY